MILPIVAYGAAILRKVSPPIEADYPGLALLIEDMWETMYESNGVGLAAPQINKNIRLFVMDSAQIFANREEEDEVYPDAPGIKKVFINAKVLETGGNDWVYNEGCLSIPKIREDITRAETVTLSYMDENFKSYTETFNGMTKAAREELIRSYNEKEVEMTERINKEVAHNQHLTKIVRGLRAYARSLKNLAEDWAPLGQPLPEVLTLPPPLLVDDEDQTLASKVQRDELERLRIKNSRLEQELKTVQAQMIASTEQYTRVIQAQKDPNLQRRLVSELEQLKAQPVSVSRPGSGQYDVDVLRKERNQLKEENKRLMQEVREMRNKMNLVPAAAPMSTSMAGMQGGSKQGDRMQGGSMQGGGMQGSMMGGGNSQALQEEVDRLNRKLKDLESLPAGTGNVRLLQQKVAYLEEVLRKLERERSELSVRATMAEEQLKNLHESMNTTIQTYQKKIADLKRALGRGRGADEESR